MHCSRLTVVSGAAAAALAVGLLVGTGAAQPHGRSSGSDQYATVQVRHDRLGLVTDGGVMINDAELSDRASITGKLLSIGDEFIVLEMEHNHEVWIPRDNVLLLRLRR